MKAAIDQIITLLPLEFRETNTVEYLPNTFMPPLISVQSLRRNVEMVIERLMDSEGKGLKREAISLDSRWASLDYSD